MQTDARRIETLDRRIARKRKREQQLHEELACIEAKRTAEVESLVLKLARETGLLQMTPREIVRRLTAAVGLAGKEDQPPARKDEQVAVEDAARVPDECGAAVIVRASRNVGEIKAAALAGLTWHGKGGYWHGPLDLSRLPRLQELFGDRVEVRPALGSGTMPLGHESLTELAETSAPGDDNTTAADQGIMNAGLATHSEAKLPPAPNSLADADRSSIESSDATPAKPSVLGRPVFPSYPRPLA